MPSIAILLEELGLGGGPMFALGLAEQLSQHGHTVTIVTERHGAWMPELVRRGLSGLTIERSRLESVVNHSRRIARYINDGDFDFVFLNASWDSRACHFATHLIHDRVAVASIVHGDWPVLYRLLKQDIEVWDCAVGVSPKISEQLRERFPDKATYGIVNGIDVPTSAELSNRLAWQLPLRLLFVGRLTDSHKGIFKLPEIVATCKRFGLDVTLTVIGDGPDLKALDKLCLKAGVNNVVELRGRLSPEDVALVMRQHHVFVFPTNTEGMPLALLEAQANGCVAVVTTLQGITDVAINHTVSGFLAGEPGPHLVNEMVKGIAALFDQGIWQNMSSNGIERAASLFSLAAMGDAYSDLVNSFVEAKRLEIAKMVPGRNAKRGCRLPAGWLDYVAPIVLSDSFVRRIRKIRHKVSVLLGHVADGP